MSYRKHAARLLGLLAVAVLGVMALASSAQAVTPEFLLNKKAVGALLATVEGAQEGTGTMLVGGLNFQLSCTTMTVTKGTIETSTLGEAELLYTGCTTLKIKTAEELPCHVKEPIHATALFLPTQLANGEPAILAEKISALILLHSNKITPEWPLGTLPCILPLDNKVTGELCLKIAKGTNETAEPLVETNSAIQGECKERPSLEALTEGAGFKDKLKYGAQEATLDGATKLFLTGAHEGLSLGVTAEPKTELCKAKTGACGAYALGTTVSASLEQEAKFIFPYEGEELEPPCRVSSASGKTTKEGEVLIGELTALSFKECGGGLCTVVAQHLPYKVEFKASSEGNGTTTWSSGGSGSPAFTIKCLGVAKCVYGAVEIAFTLTGGTPAKLSSSGVALKREEGSEEACGEKGAKWEGVAAVEGKLLYKITSPSPLFVRPT